MRVLITGVSGFLGKELARRFLEAGHQVAGISRRQPEGLTLNDFFPVHLGAAAPEAAFEKVGLLIHAAHDRSPGSQAVNVEGTRCWAEQALSAGVGMQVFLSSVSAHADAPSEYGRAKALLEAYFDGVGALIVRPGLVVGTGGTFGDLARLVRKLPLLPVLGGDALKVVLTDVESLYQTLAHAPRLNAGQACNLFQPEWVGLLSLTRQISAHLKTRTLCLPVPLQFSMALLNLGQRLGLPPTLGPENLRNLERCQSYGYLSSYSELSLPLKSLKAMLQDAFPA